MVDSQRHGDTHPRALNQIKHVLNRDFVDLINMDDFENRQPQELEKARLSRAVACLALRGLTDLEDHEIIECLVDGRKDEGIDAIAISETSREIWLVQAKWSEKGNAGVDKNAALKLMRGWRLIDNNSFDQLNARIQKMEDRLRAVLRDPHARVHLVATVTGSGNLSSEVQEVFDDELAEANGHGLTLDYRVVNTTALWQQIRVEEAPKDVEIQATMKQWVHVTMPTQMYQGIVPADQVARWYGDAGEQLFRKNIRSTLGINDVNAGIVETLREHPEYFLLFHNGITIICDSVETEFPQRRRQDEPVILRMRGASVVNGAQSVTSLHHAGMEDPECVQDADVSVHVICTRGMPSDLPDQITRTRNRQNQVLERDFVALDETQTHIREEFALLLEKSYAYKRGEADPAPDQGCSVVHAAVALACAHPNTKLAVRAKQNVDTLWERGSDGAYDMLFGEQPGAHQIWGSVRLHRQVVAQAHEVAKEFKGRASDMAERGDFLLAHLIFQMLDPQGIEHEDYDWEGALTKVPELVAIALPWLVHHVDQNYADSRSSLTRTLSDPQRCKIIIEKALIDIRAGHPVPKIPESYHRQAQQRSARKLRRPNSVNVLKDAGVLSNGTRLLFQAMHKTEDQALRAWLTENPLRTQATWTNNRRYPLLWSMDGEQYSPSGLVMHMYSQSGWENSPVSVQGPSRWFIDGTSLTEMAERILADLGEED